MKQIPCRTAMRARFPLNGTYFQVNEVFADYASMKKPIHVPRKWIWSLKKQIAYFGTGASSMTRGK
ncbi:putative demeter, domain-containing protein [Medicago truncatula]|uniref:Putative demeter, domain-containing protein n=1 Tax=Medicago truncatula TaxID=3880 RepID=A0A396I1G3_MEDTR|nr:putative demeter, domain-containing protein [Medicago truncatula]